MINERADYSAFVPAGDNRRETARILVELADKHGISQEAIQSTNRGFNVTDEIADLLYSGEEPEASGNYTGGDTDKSVPKTQTSPQTHEGLGDSTEGGLQHTKAVEDHDANGNVVDEDGNPVTVGEPVDYSEWEYAALKAEVAKRDIEVENQKAETLIAALSADDLTPTDEIK